MHYPGLAFTVKFNRFLYLHPYSFRLSRQKASLRFGSSVFVFDFYYFLNHFFLLFLCHSV